MSASSQVKFRRRVKVWLLDKELNVKELAARIGRRRDTVSQAINQEKFPLVRRQIEEAIAK